MGHSVVSENEIRLGGYAFRTTEPPRRTDMDRFPGRVITGDVSETSETRASAWVIKDLTGGIGVLDMDEDTQMDRSWFSLAETMRSKAFGLPPYAHDAGGSDYTVLAEFEEAIYGADSKVYKRSSDVLDTWTEKHTLLGAAKGWAEYDGKLYIACGNDGYSYSADGEAWADVAEAAEHLCVWDGKLFKLSSAGNISYSTDGTTWTSLLDLDYPAGYYTGLFVYLNLAGESCLYVVHKKGLDWIDFTTPKAHTTGLILPKHPHGGKAAGVWRGDYVMYGAGLSAYAWTPGQIRAVGLDRDDGVPASMRGVLVDLASGHYALYAALDNTLASTPVLAGRSTRWHFNAPKIMNEAVGFSFVLAWNGTGWHPIWMSGEQDKAIRCMLVSDAHSDYRLWFVADGHVWYIRQPLGVYNPKLHADSEYAASGQVITPWMDGKMTAEDKAALECIIRLEAASVTETVTVSYGVDGSEAWTQIAQYTANGSYEFSSGGLEFERIRFKFDLARGSDITKSPWVTALKFRYRRSLSPLRSWDVRVDCSKNYGELTPREMIALLNGYSTQKTLVELITDNSGTSYWVECKISGIEATGKNRSAMYRLMLSEVL